MTITQWHPVEEAWKDPDEPLPADARAASRRARRASSSARRASRPSAARSGRCGSTSPRTPRRSAVADRLEGEGLAPLRRWKHVFLSVATEDEANALAERLRGESLGAENIIVEGTAADAWRAMHPYAVLDSIAALTAVRSRQRPLRPAGSG